MEAAPSRRPPAWVFVIQPCAVSVVDTMAFPVAGTLQLPGRCSPARSAPACPPAPALRSAVLGERTGCLQARAFCGCQLQSGALLRRGGGSRTVTTMAAKGAPNAGAVLPFAIAAAFFYAVAACLLASLCVACGGGGRDFRNAELTTLSLQGPDCCQNNCGEQRKSFKFTGDAVSSTCKGHPQRRSL